MTDPLAPAQLPTHWRATAATLRGYGADAQAGTLERCAEDLERALTARGGELLTLRQAVRAPRHAAGSTWAAAAAA